MKEPSPKLIRDLVAVLYEAEHPDVAVSMVRGFLWAAYPQWYEQLKKRVKEKPRRR